jgi:hypothetical protein
MHNLIEETAMHNLMLKLPMVGTLGIMALAAGPLARLPIDLGAWLLLQIVGRRSS